MNRMKLHGLLEQLHARCNRFELIAPDPLECVYRYDDTRDREVVGLIAATLAYGRVAHVLQSVDRVLNALGPRPSHALLKIPRKELAARLDGFQHRWTRAKDVVALLDGAARALHKFGTLEACFLSGQPSNAESTLPGLVSFSRRLRDDDSPTSLVSAPEKGSACKRLHLYLRWMVRRDAVDPGCWTRISPALLVVPLDTHMHRFARSLRMTRRKQANLAAALDMTRAFRQMNPDDPLKYDFAITRLGIRNEMDLASFLRSCRDSKNADAIVAAGLRESA